MQLAQNVCMRLSMNLHLSAVPRNPTAAALSYCKIRFRDVHRRQILGWSWRASFVLRLSSCQDPAGIELL